MISRGFLFAAYYFFVTIYADIFSSFFHSKAIENV